MSAEGAPEAAATKTNLKAVLDLLAGHTVENKLLDAIPGAERLQAATPEDLLIFSFSGHGHADDHGNFFLLPEDIDAGSDKVIRKETLDQSVSSDKLAEWLRDVDAGDLVMIVDACHSAASVEGDGFKPGPMGSRGLGQLAFDKGMRILAASQAADEALESDLLGQGLLSYALVKDGLELGKADFKPKDGAITLAEWLAYGAGRVPILYSDLLAKRLQVARNTKGGVPKLEPGAAPPRTSQEPAMFDFSRAKRDVMLVRPTFPP